jgi:hypothetical protein
MQQHLKNIAAIIKKFIVKYNFNKNYLRIEGEVVLKSHRSIKISCNNEFDDFTIAKVKDIEGSLYMRIHGYLYENNIDKTLYIKMTEQNSFHSPLELYFKDNLIIRL